MDHSRLSAVHNSVVFITVQVMCSSYSTVQFLYQCRFCAVHIIQCSFHNSAGSVLHSCIIWTAAVHIMQGKIHDSSYSGNKLQTFEALPLKRCTFASHH